MKILKKTGCEELSYVYLAEMREGKYIEFVESIQPPLKREDKWVFIISTLLGCPVKCPMCDAGDFYKGRLTKEELFDQIDYMVVKRYPNRKIPSQKFKIQFCRMGEPTFNPAVLEALKELPQRYQCPGLKPSLSTVAPKGVDSFLEKLLEIKNRLYSRGHFQLQFSIHTTDQDLRNQMIPIKKWGFSEMADFGAHFYREGDQKVTLNFALDKNHPLEAKVLRKYFDPRYFLIKITPLNPTVRAREHNLESAIRFDSLGRVEGIARELEESGYDVLISMGHFDEDKIGSNCGQYVRRFLESQGGEGLYEYVDGPMKSTGSTGFIKS